MIGWLWRHHDSASCWLGSARIDHLLLRVGERGCHSRFHTERTLRPRPRPSALPGVTTGREPVPVLSGGKATIKPAPTWEWSARPSLLSMPALPANASPLTPCRDRLRSTVVVASKGGANRTSRRTQRRQDQRRLSPPCGRYVRPRGYLEILGLHYTHTCARLPRTRLRSSRAAGLGRQVATDKDVRCLVIHRHDFPFAQVIPTRRGAA